MKNDDEIVKLIYHRGWEGDRASGKSDIDEAFRLLKVEGDFKVINDESSGGGGDYWYSPHDRLEEEGDRYTAPSWRSITSRIVSSR